MDDGALLDALGARSGIVCVVGAGGKKSIMAALAAAHPGRVGLSATTRFPPLPAGVGDVRLTLDDPASEDGVVAVAREHRVVVFTGPASGVDRLEGLPPATIAALHEAAGFDLTVVKADGARMRLIKAPGAGEPRLVPGATTVLLVVSARAVGRPLDDRVAHRPERIAALTGTGLGTAIAPATVARLLVVLAASLAHGGTARVIPVINMADDDTLCATAQAIARESLCNRPMFDRIIVSSFVGEPAILVIQP
ncbi:MAG: putative selenium-dependent hydroxylase accessory protein YqeC [Alphaproteobacteria bacterium]|nr:putative selenium-dependent hydroxylase accessory protein YqeC [Alphaproteobacteria bacterium]